MIKIDKKITKFRVDKPTEAAPPKTAEERKLEVIERNKDGSNVIQMHEKLERPECLVCLLYTSPSPRDS